MDLQSGQYVQECLMEEGVCRVIDSVVEQSRRLFDFMHYTTNLALVSIDLVIIIFYNHPFG